MQSIIKQEEVKKAGICDIHFHDIRAKALTDAKRQGKDAQQLAGYATSAMTDRYVKSREIEVVEPLEKIG